MTSTDAQKSRAARRGLHEVGSLGESATLIDPLAGLPAALLGTDINSIKLEQTISIDRIVDLRGQACVLSGKQA
jgi:hypothetical protein